MSEDKFIIQKYCSGDKEIEIHGKDLSICVDYDDVDHLEVEEKTKHMVGVLNTFWDVG